MNRLTSNEKNIVILLEEIGFCYDLTKYGFRFYKTISKNIFCFVRFLEENIEIRLNILRPEKDSFDIIFDFLNDDAFVDKLTKIIDYHKTIIYYFEYIEGWLTNTLSLNYLLFHDKKSEDEEIYLLYGNTRNIALDLSGDYAELYCLISDNK